MRLVILAALLGFLTWFQFGQDSSMPATVQRIADLAEARPVRSVLIVGNSRSYFNDMPGMLRKLANSRASAINLEIETSMIPGGSFEMHWSHGRTKRLLGDGWDEVILQGESGAQTSREQAFRFQGFGAELAGISRVREGKPTLVVNWPYDRSVFRDYEGYDRAEHLAFLSRTNSELAQHAHLKRINLAGLWESVKTRHPSLAMTTDGNHPTLAGSYLYALAIYAHVTGQPVSALDYVPYGLDQDVAKELRMAVDSFPVSLS